MIGEAFSAGRRTDLSREKEGYFKQGKRKSPGESYYKASLGGRRSVFRLRLGWEVEVGACESLIFSVIFLFLTQHGKQSLSHGPP